MEIGVPFSSFYRLKRHFLCFDRQFFLNTNVTNTAARSTTVWSDAKISTTRPMRRHPAWPPNNECVKKLMHIFSPGPTINNADISISGREAGTGQTLPLAFKQTSSGIHSPRLPGGRGYTSSRPYCIAQICLLHAYITSRSGESEREREGERERGQGK